MHAGYPFPIPKTGYEAMWNHLLRYNGLGYEAKYDNLNVDCRRRARRSPSTADAFWAWPIYDPKQTATLRTDPYWRIKLLYIGPARRAGEALLIVDSVNPLKQPRPGSTCPASAA